MFRPAVSLVLRAAGVGRVGAHAGRSPCDTRCAPGGGAPVRAARRGGRPALRPQVPAERVRRARTELGDRPGRPRGHLRRQQRRRPRVRRRILAPDQDAQQDDGAIAGERRRGPDLRGCRRRVRLPRAGRHGEHDVCLAARTRACGASRVRRRVADPAHPGGHLLPVAAVPVPVVGWPDSRVAAADALLPGRGREWRALHRAARDRTDEDDRRLPGGGPGRAAVRRRGASRHPAVRQSPHPHRHPRRRPVSRRRHVGDPLSHGGGRVAPDDGSLPRRGASGRHDRTGHDRWRHGDHRSAGAPAPAPRRRVRGRGFALLCVPRQAGRRLAGHGRRHREGRDALAGVHLRSHVRARWRLGVVCPPARRHPVCGDLAGRVLPRRVEHADSPRHAASGHGVVHPGEGDQHDGPVLVVSERGRSVRAGPVSVARGHRRRALPHRS